MIKINQVKLPIRHTMDDLWKTVAKRLEIDSALFKEKVILKKSVDARKKPNLMFVYTVAVSLNNSDSILERFNQDHDISYYEKPGFQKPAHGSNIMKYRPVVAGSGPCGLFCAWMLAKEGFAPIIIERGKCIEERQKDVDLFWRTGILNPNSNVQFGEGGAGTFSDGKLNTMVHDREGYLQLILDTFVRCGAPEEILYLNKPHLGTDLLKGIVTCLRKEIISLGGEFCFEAPLHDIRVENGRLVSCSINGRETPADVLVLALGHSARDTFRMLSERNVHLNQKAFAIGLRIEHPQTCIDRSQYGTVEFKKELGAADYKLTYHTKKERSVYSFCMCPGGVVVNAASEFQTAVTNGMSYYARDCSNANSALVVNIKPEDFGSSDVLAGVEFQRRWERAAFEIAGNHKLPVQLVDDFLKKTPSRILGSVEPSSPSGYVLGNLSDCLPYFVAEAIREAIPEFNRKISGFAARDAVLSGVETRTSSPITIVRGKDYRSNIDGIYPAGEGAGYAGGIMSAAADGIRTAVQIIKRYKPF